MLTITFNAEIRSKAHHCTFLGSSILPNHLLLSGVYNNRIARGGAEVACTPTTSREDLSSDGDKQDPQ